MRTVTIVPAILVNDKAMYRTQIEACNTFSHRIQIDVSDGGFAPATTLDISNVWWPQGWVTDLHLMALQPSRYMEVILKLAPSLCILHAEAREDLRPLFQLLKSRGIRTGVALLPTTYPGLVKPYIEMVDHVLIFAGKLGAQGAPADLMQMEKIPLVREIKPELEIGWDGGANLSNVRALAHADLDVINVGAAISRAQNPAQAYQELVAELDKSGVVL